MIYLQIQYFNLAFFKAVPGTGILKKFVKYFLVEHIESTLTSEFGQYQSYVTNHKLDFLVFHYLVKLLENLCTWIYQISTLKHIVLQSFTLSKVESFMGLSNTYFQNYSVMQPKRFMLVKFLYFWNVYCKLKSKRELVEVHIYYLRQAFIGLQAYWKKIMNQPFIHHLQTKTCKHFSSNFKKKRRYIKFIKLDSVMRLQLVNWMK